MNILKKFFNNTRKPEGKLGKMMVNRMNGSSHAALAKKVYDMIFFDCFLLMKLYFFSNIILKLKVRLKAENTVLISRVNC